MAKSLEEQLEAARKRKAVLHAKLRKQKAKNDQENRKARSAALFTIGASILAACRQDPDLQARVVAAFEGVKFRSIDIRGLELEAPWLLPASFRPIEAGDQTKTEKFA